jgi:hypothetical protein
VIQTFEIVVEYRANDEGYNEEELLDLLRNAIGNEYDTVWHSVVKIKEVMGHS